MNTLEDAIDIELSEYSEHSLNDSEMRREVASAMTSFFLELTPPEAMPLDSNISKKAVFRTVETYSIEELRNSFNAIPYWYYDTCEELFVNSIPSGFLDPETQFADIKDTQAHAYRDFIKNNLEDVNDYERLLTNFRNKFAVYVLRYIGKDKQKKAIEDFLSKKDKAEQNSKMKLEEFIQDKGIVPLPDNITTTPTIPVGTTLYTFEIYLNVDKQLEIKIIDLTVERIRLDSSDFFHNENEPFCKVKHKFSGSNRAYSTHIVSCCDDYAIDNNKSKLFFKREDAVLSAKSKLISGAKMLDEILVELDINRE